MIIGQDVVLAVEALPNGTFSSGQIQLTLLDSMALFWAEHNTPTNYTLSR